MDFSIVVPVYNTEKYLAECVDSVLRQEGDCSFEIILVDNGSPDHAGAMCDAYAEQDTRVQVVHLPVNRRPGGGRNAGLQAAQGEYVIILDSDDYWEPNLLSKVDGLLMDKPDMAIFGYHRLFQDGHIENHQAAVLPGGESGAVWIEKLFERHEAPDIVPWCYAYRREFLNKHMLTYREDLLGPDDFEFNMRAIPLANSIVGTDTPLYYNRVHAGSIMNSGLIQTYLDGLTVIAEAYRRMQHFAMADYYAGVVLGITFFPASDAKEAVTEILKNLDILQHTTSRRKLLLPLIRLFGVYRGAKVYKKLQDVKSKLS